MSSLEILSTAFAFLYIILSIAERQISWLLAIVSSLLYVFLFWQSKLYYQSALQVFFILSGLYGWWAWDQKREAEIKISSLSSKQNLSCLGISILAGAMASLILRYFSDSPAPFLDAITTVFSITATLLTAHKKIESWFYWILINIFSIWLFSSQQLSLTSIVYIAFLILAIIGLNSWSKKLALK